MLGRMLHTAYLLFILHDCVMLCTCILRPYTSCSRIQLGLGCAERKLVETKYHGYVVDLFAGLKVSVFEVDVLHLVVGVNHD